LLLAAFVWAYWGTLGDLWEAWGGNPEYTHGYLVIPFALLTLWLRWDEFPAESWRPSWLGLIPMAIALGMRAAGSAFFMHSLEGWSILLWAAGAVWLLGGFSVLRFCLPSIGFLFFMVPLPYRLSYALSTPLRRAATLISTWLLQLLGQPALAEGNTILLDQHHLGVQHACSGLRIFMGIVAIAFAYVIATRRAWWEKILILASALPVALAANSARIVVTALLYRYVSKSVGHQFNHDVAGWAMIPFAAILFALFLWYLSRLFRETETIGLGEVVARHRAR
jgi:exosortase